MRYRRLFIVISALSLSGGWVIRQAKPKVYFLPFDHAQIKYPFSAKEQVNFYERISKKKWQLVSQLYKTHLAGKKKRSRKERIPKIIHQIWLSGPPTEDFFGRQKTWISHHPKWEYHLWTEDEIRYLYLQHRALYDSLSTNDERSQLLRFEILNQFGGVFIDHNLICYRSLDILNESTHFFTGITHQIRMPTLSDLLIGSVASHPIIRSYLHKIREEQLLGKGLFTDIFFEVEKRKPPFKDVVLPVTYFTPSSNPLPFSFSKVEDLNL